MRNPLGSWAQQLAKGGGTVPRASGLQLGAAWLPGCLAGLDISLSCRQPRVQTGSPSQSGRTQASLSASASAKVASWPWTQNSSRFRIRIRKLETVAVEAAIDLLWPLCK